LGALIHGEPLEYRTVEEMQDPGSTVRHSACSATE